MYVHIGDDIILQIDNIIAIVDQQTIDITSKQTIDIIYDDTLLNNGNFKSIVVTDNQLYLSSFSSNTLKKRIFDNYLQKPEKYNVLQEAFEERAGE
ncbi:extracellular matrix regulator RemB [Bacillus sp. Hm123]|uniref:extracellular matrix regulator RemB n=1 Tax=Bacillus sp. Hm123 TaxID=3450745 RepID=UPI003F440B53